MAVRQAFCQLAAFDSGMHDGDAGEAHARIGEVLPPLPGRVGSLPQARSPSDVAVSS